MKALKICCLLLPLLLIPGCSLSKGNLPDTAAKKSRTAPNNRKVVRIAGSGSNIPITQKLLDEYEKKAGVSLTIPKSIGSAGAIKAVQEGDLEIGLLSRSLKDGEKQEGIKQIPYMRIGVVLGVHPQVPDDNISSEDLISIYKGEKNKWKNGQMIIVLSREAGDSSNLVLEKYVPGFKETLEEAHKMKRWETCFTDQEENEAIKETRNSFGLTDTGFLGALDMPIKPLKFNGVAPTLDNIRAGTYKLYKDLYLVYKEPLSVRGKMLVDFFLSEEGRKVITDNGGIPITGE